MKNLENYGVQEMDSQEIMEIEGGELWETVVGVVLTCCGVGGEIVHGIIALGLHDARSGKKASPNVFIGY